MDTELVISVWIGGWTVSSLPRPVSSGGPCVAQGTVAKEKSESLLSTLSYVRDFHLIMR